jgi:hypothetical protein
MTRKELLNEVRRRSQDFPEELQRMTETMVIYCTWRGSRTEADSHNLCSDIVDRGRDVTAFLERHGMLS